MVLTTGNVKNNVGKCILHQEWSLWYIINLETICDITYSRSVSICKGLVEILHDYKDNPKYKGQNGWVSEGGRIITSKFNEKFPVAHFTKKHVQEKEKELKANYKALRDAKRDNGNGWNEFLCMILTELKVWEKLIVVHTSFAPAPSAPTLAPTPDLPPQAPTLPPPAPALPPQAPVERSNSEQSLHDDLSLYETSSARNENNEAQSASSNQDSRQGEGGKKRKQIHIGSALEGYVEYKKSQTSKTLEALEEKKRHEEEFSVKKCVDQVNAKVELTDEEKSYPLDLFESETLRKTFITSKNPNV
uniref:Myb/SANT-like domain-containing protein n=1 Tax=Setaria italica TaxID=4555 RepID=K4A1A0_SETIT